MIEDVQAQVQAVADMEAMEAEEDEEEDAEEEMTRRRLRECPELSLGLGHREDLARRRNLSPCDSLTFAQFGRMASVTH